MTELQPFDPQDPCSVCGFVPMAPKIKACNGNVVWETCQEDLDEEYNTQPHLHVTCRQCGHRWYALPAQRTQGKD